MSEQQTLITCKKCGGRGFSLHSKARYHIPIDCRECGGTGLVVVKSAEARRG